MTMKLDSLSSPEELLYHAICDVCMKSRTENMFPGLQHGPK